MTEFSASSSESNLPSHEEMSQHNELTTRCVDLINHNVDLWDDNGYPLESYPNLIDQGIVGITKKLWLQPVDRGGDHVSLIFVVPIAGEPDTPTVMEILKLDDQDDVTTKWSKSSIDKEVPWKFSDMSQLNQIADDALRERESDLLLSGYSIDDAKGAGLVSPFDAMVDSLLNAEEGLLLEEKMGLKPAFATGEELNQALNLLRNSVPVKKA